MIYIARCYDYDDLHKVGFSKNPEARVAMFSCNCKRKFCVIKTFETSNDQAIERLVHINLIEYSAKLKACFGKEIYFSSADVIEAIVLASIYQYETQGFIKPNPIKKAAKKEKIVREKEKIVREIEVAEDETICEEIVTDKYQFKFDDTPVTKRELLAIYGTNTAIAKAADVAISTVCRSWKMDRPLPYPWSIVFRGLLIPRKQRGES